jgi:hypothetical protein
MFAFPFLESIDTTTKSSAPPTVCSPESTCSPESRWASPSSSSAERGRLWLAFAAAARAEEAAADQAIVQDYQAQLSTPALIAAVRGLLFSERRAGRLVCRYLADLADRIHERQDGELGAYVDEFHAAACFFDLGARETRERVRIGRALRGLPQIEAAFIAGALSYSRVREVTRVARPETEAAWLELARSVDMRSLERRVAGAVKAAALETQGIGAGDRQEGADSLSTPSNAPGTLPLPAPREARDGRSTTDGGTATGRSPTSAPARTEWLGHDALRVTFTLSAEAWALLERALEGARHRAETRLSDAEALEAVARDALAAQNHPADASDPRCAVVVYECERCGKNELDTGVGPLSLGDAAAATLACGARELRLDSEGRGIERGGPLPAATRRAVLLRDRCRCRVPRCRRRRCIDVHHIVAQAAGGEHSRSNCVTLCTTHHRHLHEGWLAITGDADGELAFEDTSGERFTNLGTHSPSPERRQPASLSKAASKAPAGGASAAVDLAVNQTPPGETNEPTPGETATQRGVSKDAAARGFAVDTHAAKDEPTAGETATQCGISNAAAACLLRIIGRRGNWTPDELTDRSGLGFPQVQYALLLLELDGRVRRRAGFVDPM